MSDYEIQKDVGKAVDWLSQMKDQAYRAIDDTYKDAKQNTTTEHKPKPAPPPSTGDHSILFVPLVPFTLFALVVLFFLYREKDSWLRRFVDNALNRTR